MEIGKVRTSPCKASTNGAVERFHRTLNSMLGKVVSDSQGDWDERLPAVMAANRESPHSSTGFFPNRLFLDRETRMPLDLVVGIPTEENGEPRNADELVQKMKETAEASFKLLREQLRISAERRKKTYDVCVKKSEFETRDWVWYWYPRRYTKKSPNWQKMYVGLFLIVKVIEPVNFVLQKTSRTKPFVVHADKIKKFFGITSKSWLSSNSEGGTPSNDGQIPAIVPITSEEKQAPRIQVKKAESMRKKNEVQEVEDDDADGEPTRPRRENRLAPARLHDHHT